MKMLSLLAILGLFVSNSFAETIVSCKAPYLLRELPDFSGGTFTLEKNGDVLTVTEKVGDKDSKTFTVETEEFGRNESWIKFMSENKDLFGFEANDIVKSVAYGSDDSSNILIQFFDANSVSLGWVVFDVGPNPCR